MDRKFILTAFAYAIIGLVLGIYMGATNDRSQFSTHSHVLLLGFVASFVYGVCHRLWLNNTTSGLAVTQFYIHQAATIALISCLFLRYNGYVGAAAIEPILGFASIAAFIGLVLMVVLFVQSASTTSEATTES